MEMLLEIIGNPLVIMIPAGLLVVLCVMLIFRKAKKAVRRSGLGSLVRMIKDADLNAQITPKSVSGGDSIFLPKIMKDYPQFNADLAKSVIENCIRDIFNALHTGDMSAFKEKYNEKVYSQCEMFLRKYGQISVTGLKVHRTAISGYKKSYGTSTIKFQTAFQYETAGSKDSKRVNQEKFETEYTFRVTEVDGVTNTALRCGYCGAPVARLGEKTCTYCDNEIILNLEKAWEITDINIIN